MRIMAVFAHPDDEIGASGTLAKHARRGDSVKLVWLTKGELASQFGDTAPAEVARIRTGHGERVAEIIGAEPLFLGFGDSKLTGGREEALAVAKVIAEFKPDCLITWDSQDVHPDHRATHWATYSAVKLARIPKLVGDPQRGNLRLFHYPRREIERPVIHVDISETVEVVEEVFKFYREFYQWPFDTDILRARLAQVGMATGAAYAERFQIAASEAPAFPYLPGPGVLPDLR